jgi:acyl carrier protein
MTKLDAAGMTIEQAIIHAAAEQGGVPVEQVSPATHFRDDLNYDSLDAVEFAMSVEDALGVKIPDEKVSELVTVQMVIDYVRAQQTAT